MLDLDPVFGEEYGIINGQWRFDKNKNKVLNIVDVYQSAIFYLREDVNRVLNGWRSVLADIDHGIELMTDAKDRLAQLNHDYNDFESQAEEDWRDMSEIYEALEFIDRFRALMSKYSNTTLEIANSLESVQQSLQKRLSDDESTNEIELLNSELSILHERLYKTSNNAIEDAYKTN